MQRRLFILIGIILAILAVGLGAFVFLQQQGGEGEDEARPSGAIESDAQPTAIPMVEVIVARQPIARGDSFSPDSLGRTQFPAGSVPPNAIANEAETIGQVANIEIAQGQIILRDYLRNQSAGSTGEAAFEVPPGRVMVAFPIDRQSSVAYAVQSGDFVDVLITVSFVDIDPEFQTILPNKFSFLEPEEIVDDEGNVIGTRVTIDPNNATDEGRLAIENEQFPGFEYPSESQRPRRVAQLTVQSAKVVRVGPWIEPAEVPAQQQAEGAPPPTPVLPDIVSIAVTPQDALVLLWARQTQARMELALRAAGDENANHSTEAVTLQYMLTRFNIAVPPKLEFAIDKSEEPVVPVVAPAPATSPEQ